MSKRRRRAVDLVHVFTEDDIADELYGDGSRPKRNPNIPPKVFFSIRRPVKKTLYNNTPFGRAVAQTYTSDTSTEWETSDEDEEWETVGKTIGTDLSEEKEAAQSITFCKYPVTSDNTDADEPGDSVAASTSKLNNITLNDPHCSNCMKDNTPLSESTQENNEAVKKPKQRKYHQCQLLRVFSAFVLDRPRSQDKANEKSSEDESVKDNTEEKCSEDKSERKRSENKSVKDKSKRKPSKNNPKGKRSEEKSNRKLAENKTGGNSSEDRSKTTCSEDPSEDNSSNAEREKMIEFLKESDRMFNLLYEKEELEGLL